MKTPSIQSDFVPALPPCASGGPVEARTPCRPFCGIAVIGSAPGAEDVAAGRPFAGPEGGRLGRALGAAGIDPGSCLLAHPFRYRPEDDRIGRFFLPRTEASVRGIAVNTRLPPHQGGYCRVPHDDDVRLLWTLLRRWEPRVLLALGATAAWALCGSGALQRMAGGMFRTGAADAPVLVTWEPRFLLARPGGAEDRAFDRHVASAAALAWRPLKLS